MNKKPFALLLLVSMTGLMAKTKQNNTKPSQHEEPTETYNEQEIRPLNELLPDFFNEFDRSIRATTVDLMASMQEELGHLHTKLETMNKQLKVGANTTINHRLTEEPDRITLDFTLPKDIKYEPTDIEMVNDRIIRLEVKDEKYTVAIGITLDRNILSGYVRTEAEESSEKSTGKRYGENRFRYGISQTTAQFEKITAEYNEQKNTLTFIIPKEFKVKNKRSIKVVKK